MLKKFMFFDHALVTRPDSNEPLPELKEVNVTCSASGYGMLIVGDLNGLVHVFGKHFTNHVYFRAHTDRVEKMHHIRLLSGSRDKPEINLLTTIGSDANSPNILRIWDLNPCLGTHGQLDLQPIFQTSIPIEPRLNILCSSATLDLNKRNAPGTLPFKLALGLNNGKVLVYDQIDPRNTKAPPTIILQGNTYPITGLFWSKNGDANTKILFITTTHTINSYNFNPMIRDLDATECLDSEKGCNLNCASLLNYSRKRGAAKPQPYEYLTVATKENLKAGLLESRDVIEFYTTETRAGCHPFDGEKQQICTFKNHIVLVGKTGIQNLNMLEIFDHKNKHIAFSLSFSAITQLVSEWDKLYVFTREGKVFELEEKDVQKKIESLKEKKLFAEAIDLGEKELDHDRESLARLYHLYGDELYRKNNYDGAKDQYIQTIGYLESSYVIRKMLDSQSIENLAQYLQELHKKKQVNSLHTTMLLNCYTKLKNPEKLLEFLQENEVEFDVKKAIDACRQAAQSTQDDATSRKFTFVALSLSKSKKFNEEYIKILIEDKPMRNLLGIIFCHPEKIWSRYPQTSDLMNDLHFTRMIENIVRDPRTFFDYLQYSKLYIAISCPVVVSSIPSDSPDEFSTSSSSSSSSSSSNIEHHVLVPSSSSETEQTIVIHLPKESIDLLDKLNFQIALADLKGFKSEEKARYLRLYGKQILEAEPEQTIAILEELSRDPSIEVQTFFPIFVKNNAHLKRFIDLLMTQETQLQNNALCDTLLELQLEELDNKTAIDNAAEESSSETSILAAQMKDMLERNDGFRKYNALVLSKFHDFHSGTLHFLKKIDGGQQVVKFYMETDNDVELFKYCQEKIGNDAVMWSEVLRFVAKGQKPTMPKVIKHIMDNHILPLMLVVQILSENKNIELSVIKDFILGQVREKDQQIRAETLEIEQKQKQTEDVQKEIHELKTQAKEFKTSKCTTCGLDLDLPTVHFLCGHSYHRKCMGGFVNICPHNDCQDLNQNIQAFEQEVSTNEEFFKLLRSSDNFTVVTEFLAKGLFTKAANPTTFTPTVSVLPTVHGSAEPQQYGLYSGGYGYGGSSSSSSSMYGGGYGANRSFYYGGNK